VLQIIRTRPLTLPLCAELKKVLIVVGSIVFWGDTVTPLQFGGYMVTSIALLSSSLGNVAVTARSQAWISSFALRHNPSQEEKGEAAVPLMQKTDC